MSVGLSTPPPPPPKLVHPLWTLTKDAMRIETELVEQGGAGWQLRMLQNHDWVSGRRFSDRADAVAHGERHRQHLLARGCLSV